MYSHKNHRQMRTIIPFLVIILLYSCKSNRELSHKTKINQTIISTTDYSRPHLIVYKTKVDYNNFVPIILSEDKTEIISYPDPIDVKFPFPYIL